MPKHADDDPVLFGYSSDYNAGFEDRHGDERGISWGEWRAMSPTERSRAMQEYVNELVEVFVVDQEDES